MATLQSQSVAAANSMVLKIRGVIVGRANGVTIPPDFGTQPVPEGIGSIMPAEHVPLDWRCEISIETFMIRVQTTSANKKGIQDVLGIPVGEDILLTEPFDLEILDKVTNQVLLAADQCTWSGVTFTIRQGAITGKDARAMALRVRQAPQYQPKF